MMDLRFTILQTQKIVKYICIETRAVHGFYQSGMAWSHCRKKDEGSVWSVSVLFF